MCKVDDLRWVGGVVVSMLDLLLSVAGSIPFPAIWIWNVVDKPPIWGITSTNGDGGLMKTTLETVDGSRLGRFFVKVISEIGYQLWQVNYLWI